MQSVFVPHGNAYVRRVESCLGCRDGNNVAIVDGRAQQLGVVDGGFGNVAELLAGEELLGLGYPFYHLRIVLQHRIKRSVSAHEVNTQGLYCCEGRVGRLNLFDESLLSVLVNPVGEIVLSGRIAHLSVLVSHHSQ